MFDFSWSNILHSNVINFAIMIAFFAYIIKKLNVGQKIEDMRVSIQQKVEESDNVKKEAENDLKNVSDSLANIESELSAIVNKAQETAKAFETKAREDLDKAVESIKNTVEKQVQSEENHVQSSLMKNVSNASVEIAQHQIKSALDKDVKLHRKYIEDFINSIDKLEV